MLGEETVLLKALEGKRGQPEQRPPHPADARAVRPADGRPERADPRRRAVDPGQRRRGVRRDRLEGRARARSSSRSGAGRRRDRRGAARDAAQDDGRPRRQGRRSGEACKAIVVGGPTGGILPPDLLDTPYDVRGLRAVGAHVGSGSVVVADDRACVVDLARLLTRFCADEACGKTIPCRIGPAPGREIGDRIATGRPRPTDAGLLADLAADIVGSALCDHERLATLPLTSGMRYFRPELDEHLLRGMPCRRLSAHRGWPRARPPTTATDDRPRSSAPTPDTTDRADGDARRAPARRPRRRSDRCPRRGSGSRSTGASSRASRARRSSRSAATTGSRSRPCATSRSCPASARAGCASSRSRARSTRRSAARALRGRDEGPDPDRGDPPAAPDQPRADLQRPQRLLPAALPEQVPEPHRHPGLPEAERRGRTSASRPGSSSGRSRSRACSAGSARRRARSTADATRSTRRSRSATPTATPATRSSSRCWTRASDPPVPFERPAEDRPAGGRHRLGAGRHGRRLLPAPGRPRRDRLRARPGAGRDAPLRHPAVPPAQGRGARGRVRVRDPARRQDRVQPGPRPRLHPRRPPEPGLRRGRHRDRLLRHEQAGHPGRGRRRGARRPGVPAHRDARPAVPGPRRASAWSSSAAASPRWTARGPRSARAPRK